MDPASALAGTRQLSVHCSQCNVTITEWVNQVKSVDPAIDAFKEDLLALQVMYDRLDASLKDALMVEAGRAVDQFAGGQLWFCLSTTLVDCQTTILQLRQALQNIEYGTK